MTWQLTTKTLALEVSMTLATSPVLITLLPSSSKLPIQKDDEDKSQMFQMITLL